MPTPAQLQLLPRREQSPSTVAQTQSPATTAHPISPTEASEVLRIRVNPLPSSLPLESADKAALVNYVHGPYVGEGVLLVTTKVAAKIWQGEFNEMGENFGPLQERMISQT